jgi:hypothetical protein
MELGLNSTSRTSPARLSPAATATAKTKPPGSWPCSARPVQGVGGPRQHRAGPDVDPSFRHREIRPTRSSSSRTARDMVRPDGRAELLRHPALLRPIPLLAIARPGQRAWCAPPR